MKRPKSFGGHLEAARPLSAEVDSVPSPDPQERDDDDEADGSGRADRELC